MDKNVQREIKEKISEIERKSANGNYIYRGEPKRHQGKPYYGKVSSSLWRQINKQLFEEQVETKEINIEFVQKEILPVVQNYADEVTDDEFVIMAELQHYGGATNLIDFTTDYLIALFFACDGHHNEKGRVILLQKNEAIKDWIKEPRNPQHRVIAQKSIFVRPPRGFIEPHDVGIVTIPADLKQPLLQYLRKYHGISTETIYNDLHGFIRHESIHHRAYIDFYIGLSHQSSGELDRAIAAFTKAINFYPNFADAYFNRGFVYSQQGDFDPTIADYNRTIELKPDYADAYNNRGLAYKEQGDLNRAIVDFTRAIELKPDYTNAYNNRGFAYSRQGDFDRAIVDYTRAIELKPDYTLVYLNRGVVCGQKGDFDRAIADFTRAIELKPDYAEAYNNRGIVYSEQGDFDRAIADFTRAIELNPDSAPICNNLGLTYRKKGDFNHAIEDFSKAIDLNPDYATAYYNRGVARLHLGEWDEARVDLTDAKDRRMNIIVTFHKEYESVEDFQRETGVTLPKDIAEMLTLTQS